MRPRASVEKGVGRAECVLTLAGVSGVGGLWRGALHLRRHAGATAIDAVIFHWLRADRAARVDLGDGRRLVAVAELRRTFDLVQESLNGGIDPWNPVMGTLVPELPFLFSFAHK